jgi:hypothetical protein
MHHHTTLYIIILYGSNKIAVLILSSYTLTLTFYIQTVRITMKTINISNGFEEKTLIQLDLQ